jgi:hypothetical protein
MIVTSVYKWLLRIYPRQYADQFGQEMTSVFEQAAAEQLKKGRFAFARFVIYELAGLVTGARCPQRRPLARRVSSGLLPSTRLG